MNAEPKVDASGNVVGVVCVGQDVYSQKEMVRAPHLPISPLYLPRISPISPPYQPYSQKEMVRAFRGRGHPNLWGGGVGARRART